jgi:ABC-type multidrug transport system ATPase subunit
VYFDGAEPTKATVKACTAYIQQHDSFFFGATVRETILFAAMVKLPGNTAADVAAKRAKAGSPDRMIVVYIIFCPIA